MKEDTKEAIAGLGCLGASCAWEIIAGALSLVGAGIILLLILRGC